MIQNLKIQNAELLIIEAAGTYNYHSTLKGKLKNHKYAFNATAFNYLE
jgi:hypothetical protein